jgi:CRP/FNR family cyclic AMP-dependent transcriptional regulator
MAIRIKVAKTAKELNDVYRLRHQVYVEGEGYFKDMPGDLIVDQFDCMPRVANIIAYEEECQTPVGTMRLNCDSEVQLPCDEVFDFVPYRVEVNHQRSLAGQSPAVVGSAGMLAIAEPWRHRRDVFLALFKMSADVGHAWGTTHIVATVNVKTASIYRRLGFRVLGEQLWIPSIGESVLPICQDFATYYQWAFGSFIDKHELIETFSGCFEYLLVDAGARIFNENEAGTEAYLISHGQLNISQCYDKSTPEISLATLGKGALFGELSLIDDQPRSASATAITNTELIVLSKDVFWQKIEQDPSYLKGLLTILCSRLRDVDKRAVVYAYGSVENRLKFFVNKLCEDAVLSLKKPELRIAKMTLTELAYMASAPVADTENYMHQLQAQGRLKITEKEIHFFGDEEI